MLNIKVTNRMMHEDFIASDNIAPYILPRKHIASVVITVALCAVIVLPMPSTWERFSDEGTPALTADSREYLKSDQTADELAASNEITGMHNENYDDYDIPSQYFKNDAADQLTGTQGTALTGTDIPEDDEIFVAETEVPPAAPPVEGTWADGTKEATGGDLTAQAETPAPGVTITPGAADQPATEETAGDQLASTDITTPGAAEGADETMGNVPEVRPEGSWYQQTIRRGDTLSDIFTFLDLPYATLNRITKVAGNKDLRLKVGDPIYFLIDKENVVMEMVKPLNKTEQVRFTRMAATDDFRVVYENLNDHVDDQKLLTSIPQAETMPLAVEAAKQRAIREAALAKARAEQEARDRANNVNLKRPRLLIAEVKKGESFATAGRRAGLTPADIRNIENIFKQKINVRTLKQGDKFRVLFSGIGTNATLYAVRFETHRGNFESFINPEDNNFYGENEFTPTAGIFRRFPLAGDIKVTSHFNPSRRHPVTRRVSPHNGVDFKASVGTPVYAPADGVVTFSGYQRAAGYYVIVSHANNFSTVYMHLSKTEVKRGQKVIVGQLIARSGNTGRTTGPHLHYEIRINDRPVNPLKIELPSSNHPNLAREQREAFANNVKILRADMNNDRLAATR